MSAIFAIFGRCSQISMPGTFVWIGLNSPALAWPGFMSNVSVCAGPVPPKADRWLRAAPRAAVGIPGHSGGSAPDSHRLPFTTDR